MVSTVGQKTVNHYDFNWNWENIEICTIKLYPVCDNVYHSISVILRMLRMKLIWFTVDKCWGRISFFNLSLLNLKLVKPSWAVKIFHSLANIGVGHSF